MVLPAEYVGRVVALRFAHSDTGLRNGSSFLVEQHSDDVQWACLRVRPVPRNPRITELLIAARMVVARHELGKPTRTRVERLTGRDNDPRGTRQQQHEVRQSVVLV